MLSYRHYFHAGNCADIFKHCILCGFLDIYTQKEKPFSAFDLHAGGGIYNLRSEESRKTGEAENGIISLFNAFKNGNLNPPCCIEKYLNLCAPYLEKNIYPGSPEIIRLFLREGDFLTLTEMQAEESSVLKKIFKPYGNIFVHRRNSYEALPALTPPKPARGFAFFDPSYEVASDYENIPSAIEKAIQKWSTGIFIVWYPIVPRRKKETILLKKRLCSLAKNKIIYSEIPHNSNSNYSIKNEEEKKDGEESLFGLSGSGMLIINPPFGLEEKLLQTAVFLKTLFSQN